MSFARRVKDTLEVVSTIAVIVAAVAIVRMVLAKPPSASVTQPQVEVVRGLQIEAAKITNMTGSGRIAIVEFSDFECPFCRKHAHETLPWIKRDFVNPGRIRYVALHFPLETTHRLALRASQAAECAAKQGRFWEMHERLFAAANALTPDDLLRYGQELGLDRTRFELCLDRDETLPKVRADLAEGRRLGVRGTPVFFIGTVRADGGIDLLKRIRGAASAETFEQQLTGLDPQLSS